MLVVDKWDSEVSLLLCFRYVSFVDLTPVFILCMLPYLCGYVIVSDLRDVCVSVCALYLSGLFVVSPWPLNGAYILGMC